MVRKYKIKLIKKSNKCIHIVISLNKKSIRSHYIEKIGTIFILKQKKIIFLSLKRFLVWLNNGAILNKYISFISSLLFLYTKMRIYLLK